MRRSLPLLLALAVVVPAAPAAASPQQLRSALRAARAPVGQLERRSAERSFGMRFYRYRQEVAGLPVLGSDLVITDAPGRRGDLLLDHTAPVARPPEATVPRGRALRVSMRRTGASRLRGPARASLAILRRRSGPRAMWRVLVPSAAPLGSFEVLVDARTGRVVRVRDLLQRFTGQARLFDPNPVVMNGGTAGLADNGDADSALLTGLRTPVSLPRLDSSTCLKGTWAHAVIGTSGSPQGEVCSASRDWTGVTRSDDRFEALMAYFHIDRTQGYIHLLGFTNVLNRQLTANVDDVAADNSFYDPNVGDGEISYGTGGVDDAEDAETIVHEYGHAVQDNQVPGFGDSFAAQAMGEGFGDYLASAVSVTFDSSQAAKFRGCWDEWDELGTLEDLGEPIPNPPCLRRVDRDLRLGQLPPDCPDSSDEHCVGQVWSGALWAIRSALGGPTADRLVIQSHFSLTPGASFQQASQALLAADAALYGGAHVATVRSILTARGLYAAPTASDDTPASARVLSVPGRVSASLGAGSDRHDVYRVSLTRGRPVVIRLRTASGDFDLRLLPPGAVGVDVAPAAYSEHAGGNEDIHYTPATSGAFFIDVRAISGAGPYTLEVASDDRDGDGVADGRDDCRDRADPRQADWDGDGHGDLCDGSAKVSVTSVKRRRTRLRVRGRMLPAALPARAYRLYVSKRACRHGRCRYRRVRSLRARKAAHGRVTLRLRLRPGRYRLQARLRASGYRHARSRTVRVRVRR